MAAPIVVVDYHKGNLLSVVRGLSEVGGEASVSDDPAAIAGASGIVLPGVGSFEDAMTYMNESGQADAWACSCSLSAGTSVPTASSTARPTPSAGSTAWACCAAAPRACAPAASRCRTWAGTRST